jgi:glycosyltransferase involved in cell wall biosynthesis
VTKQRRINIAFINEILEIGGQEIACLNILKNINKKIFLPVVYAFRGGAFLQEIKDMGIKVFIGSEKESLSFYKEWTQEDADEKSAYLRILIDQLKKDAIDIALLFGSSDGAKAAYKAGVPVIIEKLDGPRLLNKVKCKHNFDKIICESNKIKEMLLSSKEYLTLKKNRLEVIYYGADLKRFDRENYNSDVERIKLDLARDEFIIGYIGRVISIKNLQLLINSLKILVSEFGVRKAKVVIVGPDHGDMENVKKLAVALELKDKVIFTGVRRDIPNILSTFDVFAITSKCEGTPNAIIEAMAMGLPIASTNVGAISEMIKDNGFLIDSFEPKVFTGKLHILFQNSRLRKKMGLRSIVLSKKYDIKKTIKKYEKLFMDCLDEKHIS